jgi:hypothetical protein
MLADRGILFWSEGSENTGLGFSSGDFAANN